jgi:hypothetical protein
MLSTTVETISYSGEGVSVTLVDGRTLTADYALVTFSLGVLQHDDVSWEPELPAWKTEAVQSMGMVGDFLLLHVICPLRSAYRAHIRRSSCNSQRSFGSIPR